MTIDALLGETSVADRLLPAASPIRFIDELGATVDEHGAYPAPSADRLVAAYRAMVLARRFDTQATALAKQGRIAAYPSSLGQEACQIGAAFALEPTDWLFPTYRDGNALLTRGIDPMDVLTPVRGFQHCGYDPYTVRCSPMTTPLATQALHATGLAAAARRRGENLVALALLGDGATSEGDFHEALNFAAVFHAPVVFVIQNNKFAISVPLDRQSAAPSLAHKGIGYGVPAQQADGNDILAVLAVLDEAVAHARAGHGPRLVELHTYRMGPHTSTDDPGRYRDPALTELWRSRDPIARLAAHLRAHGELDDAADARIAADAEQLAADVRAGVTIEPAITPTEMIDHVYAAPPASLLAQRAALVAELTADTQGPTAAGQEQAR